MAYYIDLFSPETYEKFSSSSRDITGVTKKRIHAAQQIKKEDILICYLTKLSRWIGILKVLDSYYIDETPRYYDDNDPFVVRFKVNPIVWLEKEKSIPIHEDYVWNNLSFTKDHSKHKSTWTGKIRSSLNFLDEKDGKFLEKLILSQADNGQTYPVDEEEYQKLIRQRIRRPDKSVSVSIPEDIETVADLRLDFSSLRESYQAQAALADIGEKMGFSIWLPKTDRNKILDVWKPLEGILLDVLPLSYDLTTLKTIEQIDILWIKRRSIVRAFEVEHTTAVYSGLLRMSDLLSLQPNMDIKLHIVAPDDRKDKVFEEIQRPTFSLLEKGPLADFCTFISYDSVMEIYNKKDLVHMTDSVLQSYEEEAD